MMAKLATSRVIRSMALESACRTTMGQSVVLSVTAQMVDSIPVNPLLAQLCAVMDFQVPRTSARRVSESYNFNSFEI